MKRIGSIIGITVVASLAIFNSCKKSEPNPTNTTTTTQSPSTASNNSPVGFGENIQFNVIAVAGATYTWKDPSGKSFSSSQNPTLAFLNTSMDGDYTVTVSVGGVNNVYHTYVTDCEIKAACYDSLTTPYPTATAQTPSKFYPCAVPNTFTTGKSIYLGATPILDANSQVVPAKYTWTGPTGSSFTSTLEYPTKFTAQVTPTVTTAGVYTVTATTSTGHTSQPATVTVIIAPSAPKLTYSKTTVGGTLTLTATLAANATGTTTTYSWSGPNGFTSTVQNPTIPNATRMATGLYTMTYITDGNKSLAGTVNVNIDFTQNGCGSGGSSSFVYNGKIYNYVEIGSGSSKQCWMASPLLNGTDSLFTWKDAVQPTGIIVPPLQGACPAGWHVPNDSMFLSLSYLVGGDGNSLKSVSQGSGAGQGTDLYGFSASLSVGSTYKTGVFWSASDYSNSANAGIMKLYPDNAVISITTALKVAVSGTPNKYFLRCLKD